MSERNLHKIRRRANGLRKLLLLVLTTMLWLSSLPVPSTAASILYTADTTGAIVVQSRRTIRDQVGHSWQVIAFKRMWPHHVEPIYLRLVGFPGQVELAHPSSIQLVDAGLRTWTLADRTAQISTAMASFPTVGQYELQDVLSELPIDQRLDLQLQTLEPASINLRLPTGLIKEWKRMADIEAIRLGHFCDQFPIEARQNPEFPAWTGCQMAIEPSQVES